MKHIKRLLGLLKPGPCALCLPAEKEAVRAAEELRDRAEKRLRHVEALSMRVNALESLDAALILNDLMRAVDRGQTVARD